MDFKEKTIQSELKYQGRVLRLYQDEVICPNGNKASREYVKHPGGVCILAVVDGNIILEKQYRYPFDEEILELPAGKLEKGEDPYFAAKRELEEETGYQADSLKEMGVMYPTVGYSNEVIHLYVATDLIKTQRHLDQDEFLDLVYLPIEKVKEMILDGTIKDGKTIALVSKYLFSK